jgi:hypothetical protein
MAAPLPQHFKLMLKLRLLYYQMVRVVVNVCSN